MELKNPSGPSLHQVGVEGALLTMASAPFIFACIQVESGASPLWRLTAAAITSFFCIAAAFLLLRRPRLGRIAGCLALAGSLVSAFPYLSTDPIAALLGAVLIIAAGSALLDFRVQAGENQISSGAEHCLQRARWAALTLPALVVASVIVGRTAHPFTGMALAASTLISQMLVIYWLWRRAAGIHSVAWSVLSLGGIGMVAASAVTGHAALAALATGSITSLLLPGSTSAQERREHWWETLLNHPARILISTFMVLCVTGTLLLLLPEATRAHRISLVDAAFTSVSAVCVTGLIVLDTPRDFTLLGQVFIVLLIQLGGLGIMTITTLALHAMGQRLSLRQERLLSVMTDTDRYDLMAALLTIVKFTFIVEGLGAVFLAWLFSSSGDTVSQAIWRGLFTAVSAFCNAGFALQSDSLIPYRENPLILHAVATLIVLGGMAPATSLLVPRWLSGRSIPIAARIALTTTTVLLLTGTFFFLAFEWSGVLAGLSMPDKIHNAWFQSVTLRTAGFNSVNIADVAGPSLLIMIIFMFIGGSPGGTAGGVKTTSIGVLALSFWASIMGRSQIIVRNKRIPYGTVNRAVIIIASGALVWLLMVLMLETTQQIPVGDIIFEVTSALGTVGLSLGATGQFDGIGKVIVMIAMFAGRIGPVTLFTLLNEDHAMAVSRCPDARIHLT